MPRPLRGEVWKVRGADGTVAAMKILAKPKDSAFQRFKAEVRIHQTHADIPAAAIARPPHSTASRFSPMSSGTSISAAGFYRSTQPRPNSRSRLAVPSRR